MTGPAVVRCFRLSVVYMLMGAARRSDPNTPPNTDEDDAGSPGGGVTVTGGTDCTVMSMSFNPPPSRVTSTTSPSQEDRIGSSETFHRNSTPVCIATVTGCVMAVAIAVAVFRSGIAVAALATYATVAYLLGWIVAVFEWPTWINRFSVLSAFAHPYTAWPSGTELLALGAMAVVGSAVAALTAERTPKVA